MSSKIWIMPQFYDDSVDHLPQIRSTISGIFGPFSSKIGAWSFRLLWIETNRSICSDGSRFGFGELWRRFRDINQSQSKLFTIQSTYMIYFNKDAWKFHMSDSVNSNQVSKNGNCYISYTFVFAIVSFDYCLKPPWSTSYHQTLSTSS